VVSANLAHFTGQEPSATLGHRLDTLLCAELTALVEHLVRQPRQDESNPVALSLPAPGGHGLNHYEMTLHRSPPWLVLELEPACAVSDQGLIGFYQSLGRTMDQLHNIDDIDALCRLAVRELRKLTGYDRVMVYRFDSDAHGQVIAEEQAPGQDPYLGLHYPAGDIPRQARQLYFRNRLRLIADVDYRSVPRPCH
jgi:light-regulated signal transduction histidine kinase (bacteriophytochrome)